jgi:hypothetical protein
MVAYHPSRVEVGYAFGVGRFVSGVVRSLEY